jgi:hypothetical protein
MHSPPSITNYVVLLLAALLLFCISCRDEYSFEGGPAAEERSDTTAVDRATARFTLIGAPQTCMDAVLTGTYQAGDTVTPEHSVILHVNVSAVGSYALTTDTLNGIYFTADGRFDTLGKQTVTLRCTGTPEAAAALRFTPLIADPSCGFDVQVLDTISPATYLLIGDPTTRCVNHSVSGNYSAGLPVTTANTVTVVVDVKTIGHFTIRTSEVNGIVFSCSAIFTKTGYQYVVLRGSGRPVKAGMYLYTPQIVGPHPFGWESCTFFVQVQ